MSEGSTALPGRPILGLDIGGTKIGLCVGTLHGRVLASERVSVDHAQRPEDLLGGCVQRLTRLAEPHGGVQACAALGAACPGPLDYKAGAFINPPNNPRWHGFRLRDWLKANVACPSAMMNDANAAAYAEFVWGASRGTSTSVFLTMSTGMGSGLIIDGRLFEGPLGLAGEIGRMRLSPSDDGPVGFGRRGSVEGYTSGPGMAQLAVSEALVCRTRGEASGLREVFEKDGWVTVEKLCELSRAGDAGARRVTERVSRELGRLMAIMTDVLNPEMFVLGTIGTAYPELFIPGALKTLKEEAIAESAAIVRVVPSGLTHRGDQQALAVAHYVLGMQNSGGRGA